MKKLIFFSIFLTLLTTFSFWASKKDIPLEIGNNQSQDYRLRAINLAKKYAYQKDGSTANSRTEQEDIFSMKWDLATVYSTQTGDTSIVFVPIKTFTANKGFRKLVFLNSGTTTEAIFMSVFPSQHYINTYGNVVKQNNFSGKILLEGARDIFYGGFVYSNGVIDSLILGDSLHVATARCPGCPNNGVNLEDAELDGGPIKWTIPHLPPPPPATRNMQYFIGQVIKQWHGITPPPTHWAWSGTGTGGNTGTGSNGGGGSGSGSGDPNSNISDPMPADGILGWLETKLDKEEDVYCMDLLIKNLKLSQADVNWFIKNQDTGILDQFCPASNNQTEINKKKELLAGIKNLKTLYPGNEAIIDDLIGKGYSIEKTQTLLELLKNPDFKKFYDAQKTLMSVINSKTKSEMLAFNTELEQLMKNVKDCNDIQIIQNKLKVFLGEENYNFIALNMPNAMVNLGTNNSYGVALGTYSQALGTGLSIKNTTFPNSSQGDPKICSIILDQYSNCKQTAYLNYLDNFIEKGTAYFAGIEAVCLGVGLVTAGPPGAAVTAAAGAIPAGVAATVGAATTQGIKLYLELDNCRLEYEKSKIENGCN